MDKYVDAIAKLFAIRKIREAQARGIDIQEAANSGNIEVVNDGKTVKVVLRHNAQTQTAADTQQTTENAPTAERSSTVQTETQIAPEETVIAEFEQTLFHGGGAMFDRFSLLKMGSGEGAQVRGWGAYLSQVRATADSYAARIGGDDGVVYEVEAPDDHVALNFDELMKDQPEAVKRVLDEIVKRIPDEDVRYGFDPSIKNREQLKRHILNNWTGEQFYNAMSDYWELFEEYDDTQYDGIGDKKQRIISLMLSKFGVAGHKFLDQVSRQDGMATQDKTYNYVIYDPSNTLEILSRNGEDVKWWKDLRSDQASFANDIDIYAQKKKNGESIPSGSFIRVMKTPFVLGLPGINADTALDIEIDANKIFEGDGIIPKHGLTTDDIKKIPFEIADPIAVYASKKSTK